MTTSLPLLAALEYAARGWCVLPCHEPVNGQCSCGKDCGKNKAKHPRTEHGLTDATTNLDLIRKWWDRWPTANIGLLVPGLILDVDPRNGGDKSLVGKHLPATVCAKTGGGGWHYFFAYSEPFKTKSVAPGLDLKGAGKGYVIAPPSCHMSGGTYSWAEGLGPGEVELAPAPDWIVELIAADARIERKAPLDVASALANVKEGAWHGDLLKVIARWVHDGWSDEEIHAAASRQTLKGYTLEQTRHEIQEFIDSARAKGFGPEPGRPEINAGDLDLPSVTRSAWQAIQDANEPPFLFRHGGRAVRIESNDDDAPLICDLRESRVRHVLGRVATWVRFKEVKGVTKKFSALPPEHVVKDVLATPDMPLPILTRIVQAPVFASDGTLQTAPGYHEASRTYHAPAKYFILPEIADKPSVQDLAHARALIVDELLGDFPFVTDAERAHAVALLLHPFTRDLIDGSTPLHLAEAPSAGTGKGLLVNVLTCPATGQPASVMTEGRDDDEWRKRITAKLRTAPTFALIDNVQRRIDSAQLAAAITAPVWEDRILGHSENTALPVRCAWIATGNNPALSNEIARRTVRIRLDAKQDRPFLRTDFRHPDLMQWVKANRAQLVWAALTLAKVWIVAGRPPFEGKTLGTFESWSKTMGGILAVSGIGGFLGNLDDFYADSDAETSVRRTFVEAWYDRVQDQEVGAAQLWDVAMTLAEPLDLGDGSIQSQKIKLGNIVRQLRDRQFGNLRVTLAGERQNAKKWRLEVTK